MSDTLNLNEIKARAEAALARAEQATPGPWRKLDGRSCNHVRSANGNFETGCIMFNEWRENAAFIAAARTDVPALAADVLALVEALEARVVADVQAAVAAKLGPASFAGSDPE